MARIGQNFSTSKRIIDVPLHQIHSCDDIIKTDKKHQTQHNFTDGCGYISTSLMNKIITEYDLVKCSAVQFRLGGAYKGVLQENPDLGPEDKILVRDSQKKFEPKGNFLDLGVIRCASFSQGHLNR